MRYLAALLVTLLLGSPFARAADPVYTAPTPAPAVYGPVVWRHADLDVHGYWYTDSQTQAIDRRIRYLEDKAAKECVDAQVAEAKGNSGLLWALLGGMALGATLAFCGSGHCAIGK